MDWFLGETHLTIFHPDVVGGVVLLVTVAEQTYPMSIVRSGIDDNS